MKAEIITIGDEILIGQIIDTNSSWIADQLVSNGIECIKRLRLVGYKGPVYIFTGLCDPEMKKQAIEAGATDYIIKSDLFNSLPDITAACIVS